MGYCVRLTFKFIAHSKRDSQPVCKRFRDFLFLCLFRRLRDHDIRDVLLHLRLTALRSLVKGGGGFLLDENGVGIHYAT